MRVTFPSTFDRGSCFHSPRLTCPRSDLLYRSRNVSFRCLEVFYRSPHVDQSINPMASEKIDRSITGCPVTQLKTIFKVEGMFFAPGHKLFLRIPGWSKRTLHLPLLESASSKNNEWEEKNATYSHHVMYFLKN